MVTHVKQDIFMQEDISNAIYCFVKHLLTFTYISEIKQFRTHVYTFLLEINQRILLATYLTNPVYCEKKRLFFCYVKQKCSALKYILRLFTRSDSHPTSSLLNISRYKTWKEHFAGYSAKFLFQRLYNYLERIDAFFI